MSEEHNRFLRDSEKIAFDQVHRAKINYNIGRYNTAVARGKLQYVNLELAKQRASLIKTKIIDNLERHLVDFAANFESHGGKVIWALDAGEAVKEILQIMRKYDAKLVVKSKSMVTEEIEINHALEKQKIESIETDLGEFIVQVAGEKPYHIVTPAMHKSKEDIATLFHEKFETPLDSTPEQITRFVREKLRKKFVRADIGITGANFLIADTGSVCLTENEGNALLTISFPRIHIAIAGIEKIIPSLSDLDLFWPLLATHGTGQNVTVYNSIVSGPRQEGEVDGPDEMYLILLDNGRTEVLRQKEQRIALTCIRCGACLNACPVYKNIGGYTYASTYSGPIGSVITPYMRGLEKFKHLSFASSLCGNCTEVCPVKIPLHELLLHNRNDSVKKGYYASPEKYTMFGWKTIMLSRKKMDFLSSGTKNYLMKKFFEKTWGPHRELPKMAAKSFHDLWVEKYGK